MIRPSYTFSIFVRFLFKFLLLFEKECTFLNFYKSISLLSALKQNHKSFAQNLSFQKRALLLDKKMFSKSFCLAYDSLEFADKNILKRKGS